jgi:predicted dehydrogenase
MFNKILFIGLGGAGQRHLRLFKKNLNKKNVDFIAYRTTNKTPLLNPDFTVNKTNTVENFYGINTYNNLQEAINLKPDLAVISTPSSMHLDYAQFCAEKNISVFIEKPLSNSTKGLQKLKNTVEGNKIKLQVGLQRRFHPLICKVNDIIKAGKIGQVLTVNFTVASYIPRWHPYENFLELYACRKELGGGVLLTEIHEIDLALWFFGIPKSVICVGGTYSNVGMDVEDTVRLILDYVKFSVQLNLSFWQKHHERSFSICGEKGYLFWNQDSDTLIEEYFDEANKKEIHINQKPDVDQMFDLQIKSIINNFNLSSNINDINDSINALEIVEAAKKSMETKRAITLNRE